MQICLNYKSTSNQTVFLENYPNRYQNNLILEAILTFSKPYQTGPLSKFFKRSAAQKLHDTILCYHTVWINACCSKHNYNIEGALLTINFNIYTLRRYQKHVRLKFETLPCIYKVKQYFQSLTATIHSENSSRSSAACIT